MTDADIFKELYSVVDPFTGTDWEECNGFIRALRFRALWEGRQRDQAWIADYGAPHFSQRPSYGTLDSGRMFARIGSSWRLPCLSGGLLQNSTMSKDRDVSPVTSELTGKQS